MLYCIAFNTKAPNEHFGSQYEDRFIFILMKTKHSVHIMVFELFTSNGDVMPPFTIPHRTRFNVEADIKCLEEVARS